MIEIKELLKCDRKKLYDIYSDWDEAIDYKYQYTRPSILIYVIKVSDIIELRSDCIIIDPLLIEGKRVLVDKMIRIVPLLEPINIIYKCFVDDEYMFGIGDLNREIHFKINYCDWLIKKVLE